MFLGSRARPLRKADKLTVIAKVVDELMKHDGNEIFVMFQIRNQLEKLANGIHIGTNYRLYAVERVCISLRIRQTTVQDSKFETYEDCRKSEPFKAWWQQLLPE
jgi:hypothetical protein